MATITHLKTAPHTRIANDIILNMAEIGVYCYAVYSAIKMHLNQANGDCFPSYARLARITGIHRSTVIECVKKLRGLKLVDPEWRFKEDGSHASNQYNFQTPETPAPVKKVENIVQKEQGSRPERLPVVAEDNHPSRPEPPAQVLSSNKKEERTTERPALPTKKQKTCEHPAPAIVYLSDNITICHHCYGLLDENLMLITEENFSVENREAEHRAWPECEPVGEPEAKHPPEAGQASVAA